jgi:DNA-binding ferritin-like protein
MHDLAVILRAAQLYAHNAHNLAQGATFFADHEELGELYPAYEGAYDLVVERMIGLDEQVDLNEIQVEAVKMLASFGPADPNKRAFQVLLEMEKEIQTACAGSLKGSTEGTKNMLQGLADDSEKRAYLIGQRVK